jgi:SSS family solute:Na+ symporter
MLFVDYCAIFIYFLAIIFIGVYSSRSVKSLSDFATGNRSYNSFFVFTTLSASFIGGGFTTGLAEKVCHFGLIYAFTLWGFSFKELLIAQFIAPKMGRFQNAISVGDIMKELYGANAKVLTGIASVFICAGIAGAQFSGFGYVLQALLDVDHNYGIIICTLIVIFYSSLGGMKSVVANDTLHFFVLIISLPIVLVLGTEYIGGFARLEQLATHNITTHHMPSATFIALFLSYFFGETLVPPYVQRLLIGKDLQNTKNGTLYSGLLSLPFFIMIGLIAIIAIEVDHSTNPHFAITSVIHTIMPAGLKGFAIAGMMAIMLSSADAFLNAAAIATSHDVIKPIYKINSNKTELKISRIATVAVGVIGALFAISFDNILDILLSAYNFWTPFILVPLVAGIMGVKRSAKTFWLSAAAGILSVLILKYLPCEIFNSYDATLVGIAINALVFFNCERATKNRK